MNDRVNRDKNGGVNSYYILYNFIIFITSGELAHMEMGSWEMSRWSLPFYLHLIACSHQSQRN